MTTEQLFEISPEELFEYLTDTFGEEVPTQLISIEDMQKAGELLGRLTNQYSYLVNISSLAKIKKRNVKRYGSKEQYEDAVDREEIINNMVEIVKHQYQSVSRCVTIKMANDNELRMTEFR